MRTRLRRASTRAWRRPASIALAGCLASSVIVVALSTAAATATTGLATAATSTASRDTNAPGPTNTGVPVGTRLTVHNGDINVTKAGTVLSGLDIHGSVNIAAPNVTLKDSIVRGGAAPSHNHCVVTDTSSNGTNFLVEDTELVPTNMNSYQNNLCGGNYSALRINSHVGVDTADVSVGNATIEDSWLHDTTYYARDPNHGGGPSHNDGVQILGGSKINIVGNTIEGGANSAIQISQDYSPVSSVAIIGNTLTGGSCSLRANDKPLASLSGLLLASNVIVPDQTIHNCGILLNYGVNYTFSWNVWSTGSLVKVMRAR